MKALRNADAAGDTEAATRIAAMISAQQASQAAPVEMGTPQPPPDRQAELAEEFGTTERLAIGAGRGITEVGQGIKQLGMQVGESMGLVDSTDVEAYRQNILAEKELVGRGVGGTTAGQVGEVAGKIAAAAPTMLIPGGAAATIAPRLAAGAAAGGVAAGAEPVYEEGGFAGKKAEQVAIGTAFGLTSTGAFEVVKAALPKNVLARFVEGAGRKDYSQEGELLADLVDIPMTPAQINGSKALTILENAARQSIYTADKVAKHDKVVAEKAVQSVQRLASTMSKPLKGAESIGREMQDATRKAVQDQVNLRHRQATREYGVAEQMSDGLPIIKPTNYIDELKNIIDEYSASDASDAMRIVEQSKKILERNVDEPGAPSIISLQALEAPDMPIPGAMRNKTVRNAVNDRAFYGQSAKGTGNIFKDISPNLDRRIANRLHESLTKDLIVNEANPQIGALLRIANDNYAANSQTIKAVEKSALGRLLGDDMVDAADIFGAGEFNTVAGEAFTRKMMNLHPSEAKTAMTILNKVNPNIEPEFKAFVLRDMLENSLPPRSSGSDRLPISFNKFLTNYDKVGDGSLKAFGFTKTEKKSFDNIVKAMERVGDRTGYNWSGTAPMKEAFNFLNAVGGGLKTTVNTVMSMIGLNKIADAMVSKDGRVALEAILKSGGDKGAINKGLRTIGRITTLAGAAEAGEKD